MIRLLVGGVATLQQHPEIVALLLAVAVLVLLRAVIIPAIQASIARTASDIPDTLDAAAAGLSWVCFIFHLLWSLQYVL